MTRMWELPEGHTWKEINPAWARSNELVWKCEECKQQLIGVIEPDGEIDWLDLEDLDACR